MTRTVTISSDVFSAFRHGSKPIQYARKGDIVTLISDHGNVLIVEGKAGRFPVNVKLTM